MILDVDIRNRDFSQPVAFPAVDLVPEWYTWHALGGPDTARIRAAGTQEAVWSLLNWLRAPVEIVDERDTTVWWGYLSGVTLQYGTVEVGVSLDPMVNRVAVTYVETTMSGNAVVRETTDWVQDDESVATYGTKELLDSRAASSATAAAARAAALLAQFRYPIATVASQARGRGEIGATLHAHGWWHTLDWRYFSRLAGLESYETGSSLQAVGDHTYRQMLAQSFQISGSEGWYTTQVAVRLRKELEDDPPGERTDDVNLHLCADSGGVPGSILRTATVPASQITESMAWIEGTFSTQQYLSPSTTYWIVISPTGALDPDNYYVTAVDEDLGYTQGVFRRWDGEAWFARDPDADMPFRISGVEETTDQIAYIVETAAPFLTGVELVDESGINSLQYRAGDNTALYEVQELLADGASAGRRLLATVTRDRVLQVYLEPARPDDYDVVLFLNESGKPEDRWGNEMLAHTCPVAQWCQLKAGVSATVNMSILASPTPFFVEEAEYRVQDGLWVPTARGVPSVWDIGRLTRG